MIRNGFAWREGDRVHYRPRLGINLRLPNVLKKLRLKITTYDEDAEERGINKYRARPEEIVEEDYGIGIDFIEQLGQFSTRFRPRVELRRGKIETSGIFAITSSANSGMLTFSPELQIFARSDTGLGQFLGLNVDLALDHSSQLSLITEAQYNVPTQLLSTNNGFRFHFNFSDKFSQLSSLIFEADNDPKYRLKRTVVKSSFVHRVFVNALHYRLTPYVLYEKPTGFKPVVGVDLMVELIF